MCNNDNRENKKLTVEDLKFFLDGCIDDDTVTIPREEYDELIAESTILRVVERIVESDAFSSYSLDEYLKEILSIGKPESEPAPVPDETTSAPDCDKEASE